MFLDAEHCQLPLLMPTDVPRRPDPVDVSKLSDMISLIADEVGAASAVVTFERPRAPRSPTTIARGFV